jgi:hypothetical protein
MKKSIISLSIIAVTALLSINSSVFADESAAVNQSEPAVAEQAPALTASVAVPILSAYVWRGIIVTDKLVAQPNVTISKFGFSFNTWTNYNFTDAYSEETKDEFSEVDLTLSYSRAIGKVTVGAIYAEYLYPHQAFIGEDGIAAAVHGTREVQLSAGIPGIHLAPSLTFVRDVDEVDGFYASIALSQNLTLTDKIAPVIGFSTGVGDKDYNAVYFGTNKAKLIDGNASVNLPFTLTDSVSLTAQIQYTWLWDSDIRNQAGALYKDDSALWGGVTLNYIP